MSAIRTQAVRAPGGRQKFAFGPRSTSDILFQFSTRAVMARARTEIVAVVPAAAKQDRPVKRRQHLTAGGIPLPRIDQRTIPAMRYRALLDSYTAELGGHPSEADKALIQQVAAMQLKIEAMQAAIVEGCDVDADQIIRLSSEHRRLLTTLRGKAVKNKPAGPSLADYLARKAAEKAASATDGDAA